MKWMCEDVIGHRIGPFLLCLVCCGVWDWSEKSQASIYRRRSVTLVIEVWLLSSFAVSRQVETQSWPSLPSRVSSRYIFGTPTSYPSLSFNYHVSSESSIGDRLSCQHTSTTIRRGPAYLSSRTCSPSMSQATTNLPVHCWYTMLAPDEPPSTFLARTLK